MSKMTFTVEVRTVLCVCFDITCICVQCDQMPAVVSGSESPMLGRDIKKKDYLYLDLGPVDLSK